MAVKVDSRVLQEHRGRHFPALSPGADQAPPQVPVDALAQQHGQPAIPVSEQRVKGRAVPASGAGHDKDSE